MTDRARLTDALALAARPREYEYAIHDTALQGFMLRLQPNGTGSWVFRFRRDGKPRRVTLGKPGAVKADQARAAALAFLARENGGSQHLPLSASGPTLTRFAREYVERRSPSWKPTTVETTLIYLNSAMLPALGHLRVGSVVRADIARFFHEYGRRKPGGANRSHEHPAQHVRLRHRVGPPTRSCRESLQGDHPLSPPAARAAAWCGRFGEARRDPAPA